MLDMLSSLRRITPIGSTGDYTAGELMTETQQQLRTRRSGIVFSAVAMKPDISVKDVRKATGFTQGGCSGILCRLVKRGMLNVTYKKVPYANRPAAFYSIPGA